MATPPDQFPTDVGGHLANLRLLHRVRTLILSADNPDRTTYPTRTFEITSATLPDVLVGQVVWIGRSLTPGPSR